MKLINLSPDKLFPGISTFGDGYGPNNDPLKGYILIFFISLGCILIGDLNAISTLLSNFFVASYALMNFSVFHASITNTPGKWGISTSGNDRPAARRYKYGHLRGF